MYYSMIKLPCSNFRVITANFRVSKILGFLQYWHVSLGHYASDNEPSHEIMALFVLHKLILQTCVRGHPLGLDVWFLVGPFVCFHTSCVRTAKALARLRRCPISPEPLLFAYAISTINSWAGSIAFIKPDAIMIKQKNNNNNCKWGWPDFLHSCSKCQMSQYLDCWWYSSTMRSCKSWHFQDLASFYHRQSSKIGHVYLSRATRKRVFGSFRPGHTNRLGQPQKLARVLKFRLRNLEILHYLSSENKGADQTTQMCRLICTFVSRIWHKTHFLMV